MVERNNRVQKVLAVLALTLSAGAAAAQWTPPDSPDPEEIRRGADEDALAGRFELASEKYSWYFENALEYEPALAGVRVSFALMAWKGLANRYSPALEEMKRAQDRAEVRVKNPREDPAESDDAVTVRRLYAFQDAVVLNNALDANDRTVRLFKWLAEENANFAHLVYGIAQDALVEAGEYALCESYLTGGNSFEGILDDFRLQLEYVEQFNAREGNSVDVDPYYMIFARRSAYIVAILVNRDRLPEAKTIADKAMQELEDETHKEQIEDALKGDPPERLM